MQYSSRIEYTLREKLTHISETYLEICHDGHGHAVQIKFPIIGDVQGFANNHIFNKYT